MPELKNAHDLLRFAIAIEENGRQVYEHFEEEAKDEGLRKAWGFLKAQEVLHAGRFERLLEGLKGPPSLSDPYLNVVASNTVFTDSRLARKMLEGMDSDIEALDFAVVIEKESILTYLLMRDPLPPDARPVLDAVIEEEKKHLSGLLEIRDRLLAK